MSRFGVFLLSIAVVLVGGQVAWGAFGHAVIMEGTIETAEPLEFYRTTVGYDFPTAVWVATITPAEGDTALEVRDLLIPTHGVTSPVQMRRAFFGERCAALLGEQTYWHFWLVSGTDDPVCLEPGVPTEVNGLVFTDWLTAEWGYPPSPDEARTIPAVSGFGLAVMVVALGCVGGAVFGRRKRHAA